VRSPSLADLEPLAALGVTELVIVDAPPADAADAVDWVDSLATEWIR
jgi:hypothetical protein